MLKSTSKRILFVCLFVAMVAAGLACPVGDGGSSGSYCGQPGDDCYYSSDCCQSGHTYGQVCIVSDGRCHAMCYYGDDCVSSCCGALQGESYGACASSGACL